MRKPLQRPDRDPDCHKNLITCSLYHPGPLLKISWQFIENFLSNVASKQTYKDTNSTKNKISLLEIQMSAIGLFKMVLR